MKRRNFLRLLGMGSGAGAISLPVMAYVTNNEQSDLSNKIFGSFTHGVASGDPTSEAIILWTRFVPDATLALTSVNVKWQISKNKSFSRVVGSGNVLASEASDFIIKVDAKELQQNKEYFYRFSVGHIKSAVGTTRTLPEKNVEEVHLAIATCANHPAGYFNVYRQISKEHKKKPYDALLHIGDYIYEYGMGEYASDNAVALDRVPSPAHECVTLTDYRKRYSQYRSDKDLQTLHAQMPFIHIWDDHEIADNSWKDGALNHQPQEGLFVARRQAAIQAFHEWLPIRDNMVEDGEIYRSFMWGDLLHLLMLDTRVTGRSAQLDYGNYNANDPAAAYAQLQKDLYNPKHELLGTKQKNWIKDELQQNDARWTVLGQQVLMTKMEVPFNLLIALLGAQEAKRKKMAFDSQIIMDAARNPSPLLAPYNLDAWDGYPRDRDWIYQQMSRYGKSFVSFAGDTHNAWAGELTNKKGRNCGIEFAAPAVSSPGMEHYLPLPINWLRELQKLFPLLIKDLKWANISDRGFMSITFKDDEIINQWIFIDSILTQDYNVLPIVTATSENALYLDDIEDEKDDDDIDDDDIDDDDIDDDEKD
jgi:alkaline phosphatase D